MSLLTKILEKLNVKKWEDLTADEKTAYEEMEAHYKRLTESTITIEDEKNFWKEQIDRLSFDITDLDISEKKRLMLIMQLRNAQLIYKFITSPEDALKFFESQLKQKFNLDLEDIKEN